MAAIGPQKPDESKELGLPFPVLSDPDLRVTEMFGLVHPKGMGVDVPRPTTVILDRKRRILWLRAADNIRSRPDPEEVLAEIRK